MSNSTKATEISKDEELSKTEGAQSKKRGKPPKRKSMTEQGKEVPEKICKLTNVTRDPYCTRSKTITDTSFKHSAYLTTLTEKFVFLQIHNEFDQMIIEQDELLF